MKNELRSPGGLRRRWKRAAVVAALAALAAVVVAPQASAHVTRDVPHMLEHVLEAIGAVQGTTDAIKTKIVSTRWTSNLRGVMGNARITVQQEGEDRGSLKIVAIGRPEQRLDLIAEPRHFGGQQWYFRCPVTHRSCSVVWLPPGATRFCSRQAWGKQVAYATQFEAPFNRAISAREKIKDRLIGNLDRREWELPPKPKWMRWATYHRLAAKYLLQQRKIDGVIADYVG